MNFDKDVIERSHNIPVVVDFWAEWCGPCKILGPVLDTLAEEQSDKWELVKINTEEYPELARQFHIMSIPHVKMFHRGSPITEFSGALPRNAVEQWLNIHLPSSDEMALEEIMSDRIEWPDSELAGKLEELVERSPDFREGRLALAKEIVLSDPDRALELVSEIPAIHGGLEAVTDVKTIAELLMYKQDDTAPSADHLSRAGNFLRERQIESAIGEIIRATESDKHFANDLPRRTGVALFRMLGSSHPLSREYRRRFDMVLY